MPSQRVSSRNPRATRACARCRKRKIRCDFVYPRCGTCTAAGIDCKGFDSTTGQEQPRSLVAFLENKVAHLEIKLTALQGQDSVGQSVGEEAIAFPGLRSQLLRAITLNNGPDRQYDAAYDSGPWRSVPYICSSLLPTLASARTVADSHWLVDVASAQKRDIASIPRNVVNIMLKHYADFYLAQYPILDESELMEHCNKVYNRTATPFELYVVCMALSISAHTLIRHDQARATKAADEFWQTALVNLDSVLQQNPLIQLQAIMLLCHYSFVNPSAVNSGMCSRAAIALCVQLGLHKEPPPENIRRHINLESQRRRFWTCYVLDAQNSMLGRRALNFSNLKISVRYPSIDTMDTEKGEKVATANYLYAFRQLETEITMGMFHSKTCGDPRLVTPDWLDNVRERLNSWREELDSRQFASRVEFRDFMFQFQRLRLNRTCPRLPNPSFAMRRECIAAGIFIVTKYSQVSRQGNFFYWHHCCWHLFEVGIVLVEATHIGLDLLRREKKSFLQSTDAIQIIGALRSIPYILEKMTHRWSQVEQMIFELDEMFTPALQRLQGWIDGGNISLPTRMNGIISRQMSVIREYLLDSSDSHTGNRPGQSSDHQFRQNYSTTQTSSSASDPAAQSEPMTMQELFQILQPTTYDLDTLSTSITATANFSEITPNFSWGTAAAGLNEVHIDTHSGTWHSSHHETLSESSIPNNSDIINQTMPLDIDPSWLSPSQTSLFWHVDGLELDDIFTAFNEGGFHE